MKNYFFKDIREHWKIVCLIGIVFTGIIVVTHYAVPDIGVLYLLTGYFPIMACGGGLILGIVAGLSERTHKRWDFMAHRPASMEAIFWGKTLAGCALLAAATLIPALVDFMYCKYIGPSWYPPKNEEAFWKIFDFSYNYPLYWDHFFKILPDLLVGFAFLYSGMSAIFLGLRLRPLFIMSIPLATLILSFTAPGFPQACIVAMMGLAISVLAARSLFKTCGQPRLKSPAGAFCVATAMFLSINLLGAMAYGVIKESYANYPPYPTSNSVRMSDEGDLVVFARKYVNQGPSDKWLRLDGTLILGEEALKLSRSDPNFSTSKDLNRSYYASRIYRMNFSVFDFNFYDLDHNKIYYYSSVEKIILIRDRKTFRDEGSLGANGFVPSEKGRAEPLNAGHFVNSVGSPQDLIFVGEKCVLRFDFEGQAPRVLFTPREGEKILSFYDYDAKGIDHVKRDYRMNDHLLITNQRVLWMDKSFGILHAEDWKPAQAGNNITVYYNHLNKAWGKAQYPGELFNPDFKPEIHFTKLNKDFEILQQTTVPYPNYYYNPINGDRYNYLSIPKNAHAIGLFIPWYSHCFENLESMDMLTTGFNQEFSPSLLVKYVPTTLWIYSILGSLLTGAFVGLVLAPIYAINGAQRLRWTMASLILGWPAILTLLLMLEKPFKPLCPSCGKKRPVNRATCPHCSTPWPAPMTDNTEIFAEPATM